MQIGNRTLRALLCVIVFLITLSAALLITPTSHASDKSRGRSPEFPESPSLKYYEKGRQSYLSLTPPNLRKAIELYNRSLELDPNFVPAHAGLAEAYSFIGHFNFEDHEDYEKPLTEANEHALKAVALDGNSYLAHRALALNMLHLKRSRDAKREARRALELNPNDAETIYILWEARGANPDSPLIKKALDIDPNLVMVHLGLGKSYFYKKNYSKSVSQLKRTLKLSPRLEFAQKGLGTALRKKGEFEKSASAYLKAIEINPNYASAYVNLGITQLYMGDIEDSIATQKKAISLNPRFPEAYYYLGRGYDLTADYPEAERLYLEFLKLASDDDAYIPMTARAERNLQRLHNLSK